MKAKHFDKTFENGESIIDFLDLSRAKGTSLETKRVNVDFPEWMVYSLDKEAKRIGVSRQSVIKMWLAERFEKTGA